MLTYIPGGAENLAALFLYLLLLYLACWDGCRPYYGPKRADLLLCFVAKEKKCSWKTCHKVHHEHRACSPRFDPWHGPSHLGPRNGPTVNITLRCWVLFNMASERQSRCYKIQCLKNNIRFPKPGVVENKTPLWRHSDTPTPPHPLYRLANNLNTNQMLTCIGVCLSSANKWHFW